MNLKHLSRTELDSRIRTLAKQERELLHEIIQTINEFDQRRLYLDLGYASLFAYLVEAVGYSAGSAQRRIDAARLLKEVPELGEKIESGSLSLVQVSLVQRASREVYRKSSRKVNREEKQELLAKVCGKNFQEAQKEVNQFFEMPILVEQKQQVQSDESVRIELTLSKDLVEKIKLAQALLSYAVPSQSLVEFLDYVADRVIKQKMGRKTRGTATMAVDNRPLNGSFIEGAKKFSNRTKTKVRRDQKVCQYRDPISQKQCGSRWFLQIDHKHSLWAGGSSSAQNAQVLCAEHNRAKYRREVGVRVYRG